MIQVFFKRAPPPTMSCTTGLPPELETTQDMCFCFYTKQSGYFIATYLLLYPQLVALPAINHMTALPAFNPASCHPIFGFLSIFSFAYGNEALAPLECT
eukprot:1144491-Pelagomonas_calceolata.AAC.1